jgi:hypothetical protein
LKWRKWLVKNGWLEKSGERGDDGTFKIPVMTVKRGDVVADISGSDGRKKSSQSANFAPRNQSANFASRHGSKLCTTARVQTLHPEVEPVKQVDSKREVKPKKQVVVPVSSVISFSSNEPPDESPDESPKEQPEGAVSLILEDGIHVGWQMNDGTEVML